MWLYIVYLQLQNIAREREEPKGASNDLISLTSQCLFIEEPIKDERATRTPCWIHLIDVHQNVVFEMGKNRCMARVTDNRCNLVAAIFGD